MSKITFIILVSKQYEGIIMRITKHGNHRIKERVGLPKRAHMRHITKVLSQGMLLTRKGYEEFKVVYQGFLYIFALTAKLEPILITTYQDNNFDIKLTTFKRNR